MMTNIWIKPLIFVIPINNTSSINKDAIENDGVRDNS